MYGRINFYIWKKGISVSWFGVTDIISTFEIMELTPKPLP